MAVMGIIKGCTGGGSLTSGYFYSASHTDNYSSYQTMFEVTPAVQTSIEIESYYNGSSTGGTAYSRQYVIDGVSTSISATPNIQTITLPAGKTCQIQQNTGGNNYPNQLKIRFV